MSLSNLEMRYLLAKQLPTATAIETNYGRIELDDEMRQALVDAVGQIIMRRMVADADCPDELQFPDGHPDIQGGSDWIADDPEETN